MSRGRREFFVEILNDDDTHGIIATKLDNFDQALGKYRCLTRGKPRMRGAH